MSTKSPTLQGPSFAASSLRRLLIAGACFSLIAIMHAQTTTPATTDDEEITLGTFQVNTTKDVGYRAGNSVSATRFNTAIKDLPFAVSAFTQQFITDTGARDLFDVARYAPGVSSAGREFNGGNASYNIRGFAQSPQRNGFGGTNYVDTVDIERVEVVKGPASVLYGQVSPGGIVNYITKRPEKDEFATVGGQIGSYDFWRVTADVNQPLVSDKLLFRFNGVWENGIQYYAPSKQRTWVTDPVFIWNITKRVSLTVDYEWFHRIETPPAQFKPNMEVPNIKPANTATTTNLYDPGFLGYYPGLSRTSNYSSNTDRRESDFNSLNTELDVKFSDHWTSRTNFTWGQNRESQKLTGLASISLTTPAGYPGGATQFAADILKNPNIALLSPSAILGRRKRLQEDFGHGEAIQAEVAGKYESSSIKFQPLVGAIFSQNTNWERLRQSVGATGATVATTAPAAPFPSWDYTNPATIIYNTDFDPSVLPLSTFSHSLSDNKAAYAILSTSFFHERLFTVIGARYNRSDSTAYNLLNLATPVARFTAHQTTPQAGIGYKVAKDVMLYSSYSQSFVQNAAFLQVNSQVGPPAKPTTSEGYEVGVKTDLLDGRISSTLSVYQIKQKDLLQKFTTFGPAPTFTTLNNNTQGTVNRSRGIEGEVTWSPLNNWQVYVSASEDDVRVIKEPDPSLAVFLGSHPESTVKTLASLWTRYTFAGGSIKGLWVGGGINYVGKTAQRVDNPYLFLPSYTLWNSVVGYDFTWRKVKYTTALNWDNMSNVEYFPANQQRGIPERIVFSVSATF
jgi:iron complex outermembrane receptor protein